MPWDSKRFMPAFALHGMTATATVVSGAHTGLSDVNVGFTDSDDSDSGFGDLTTPDTSIEYETQLLTGLRKHDRLMIGAIEYKVLNEPRRVKGGEFSIADLVRVVPRA